MSFFKGTERLTDSFITEQEFVDAFIGGQLKNWGLSTNGRLGDNNSITRSSPVQTVAAGVNWVIISGGGSATNGVKAGIKTDGTLWLWGDNTSGQLGNSTSITRSSPVQTVSTGTNWKSISFNENFPIAVKTDGTLWLWGGNANGRLGLNTSVNVFHSSPVQTVATGTNWCTAAGGVSMAAAIKSDGTLWLWGVNTSGHLGDNTIITKSSPVQTVATGTNWSKVGTESCGTASAIKSDGTLWLWGGNGNGTIGDNSSINKSSPVQTVATGTNWKSVSSGGVTAGLKRDGTLWMWGLGSGGGLGDNSSINKSSPVQTVATGTNWKIACAGQTAVVGAIKTNGTLWMWGCNSVGGGLGDNSSITKSSPVQTVIGGTNWKSIVPGLSSLALENC